MDLIKSQRHGRIGIAEARGGKERDRQRGRETAEGENVQLSLKSVGAERFANSRLASCAFRVYWNFFLQPFSQQCSLFALDSARLSKPHWVLIKVLWNKGIPVLSSPHSFGIQQGYCYSSLFTAKLNTSKRKRQPDREPTLRNFGPKPFMGKLSHIPRVQIAKITMLTLTVIAVASVLSQLMC